MSLLRKISAGYHTIIDDALIAAAFFATGIVFYKVYPYHLVLLLFIGYNITRIHYRYIIYENLTLSILSAMSLIAILFDIAALFYGLDFQSGFKYLVIECIGLSVIYAVIIIADGSLSKFNRTINIAFGILAINCLFGLLEILTPFRWVFSKFSSWIWISGATISAADAFQMNMYPEVIATTPTGLYWNPNDFALMIGLLYPFVLLSHKRFTSILSAMMIICVAFASARLVFYSMMIVLVIIGSLKYKSLKPIIWLNGLLFIIVITNGFFLLYYHIPQWYDISIQSLFIPPPPNLLQAQSGITRFDLLKEGLKVFIEHPLFGIGAGNFQYHMLTKAARSPDAIVDMHLYWFQLLVEKGILYFILLSASIIMLLKSIYIRYTITSGKMKEFGLSILLSLFVLCFGGMSVSSLAYYLPMYAIIGIAISYLIIPRNNAYSTSG